jgi:hypothetical protein
MTIINDDFKQNSILTLTNLIADLEEVTEHFNRIGVGFDHGEIDFVGFEMALLQLHDCQDVLEEILDNRQQMPRRP